MRRGLYFYGMWHAVIFGLLSAVVLTLALAPAALADTISSFKTKPDKAESILGLLSIKEAPANVEYREGVTALTRGDLDAADAAFKESLRLQPKRIAPVLGLAEVALQKGDPEVAGKYLEEALALAPESATVQTARGLYFSSQRKFGEAETAFKEGLRLDPRRAEALLGLADIALKQGNQKGAGEHLQKAVAVAPKSGRTQRAWGHYLFSQKRFREAEAAFKRAIELNPRAVVAHLSLGDLYLIAMLQPREAIKAYRAALDVDPNHAGGHYGLGMGLAATGETDEAVAELEEARRLAPNNPLPFQALGLVHAARKEYEKALEAFAAALRAQPKFFQAHVARAGIFMARGEDANALGEATAALKIAPNFAPAHVQVGMVHERNKRVAEAQHAYLTAIKLDPKQSIAYNNLAWLAAERRTRLDDALTWAKKAVELGPKVPQFQDTLGWVYRARGELDKAIPLLQKAAALKPQNAEILYHLGVVYAETGQAKEAAATLRKALALKDGFGGADDARRRLAELGQVPSGGA